MPAADQPMPWSVVALADFATHDIAQLSLLLVRVSPIYRSDIVHATETLRRLALFVEAIGDEPDECALRIAARAQAHEERLKRDTEILLGSDMGTLMRALFREHRLRRSPGEARARHMGFERRLTDDVYGGG